jgi:hypothetical protein
MILDNGCLPKLAYMHIKINAYKNMSFFMCVFPSLPAETQ